MPLSSPLATTTAGDEAPQPARPARGRRLGRVLLVLAVALFVLVAVKDAWVSEDAFLTFRTVANWLAGFGLRWNVAERVQAYTHPLWMLLLAPAAAVTHEYLITSTLLSLLLAVATLAVLAWRIAASELSAALAVLILVLSKAFVDYSTSGLENPLTHLLLAALLAIWWSAESFSGQRLLLLSGFASLVAVDRLDAFLICLPVVAAAALGTRRWRSLIWVALGMSPLALWEIFSVLYYGFPFPNTAYAKLGAGIPAGALAAQGLRYLGESLQMNPITLVAIAVALVIAGTTRALRSRPVAAGILLYLLYVVAIGGDFMSGRFLTAPLLAAAAIIARRPLAATRPAALAVGAVALVGLVSPHCPLYAGLGYGEDDASHRFRHGISDERAYFYPYTGLINVLTGAGPQYHLWGVVGAELSRLRTPLAVLGNVGFSGFYAGPSTHIVDRYGLADPLLARLPMTDTTTWRPGHVERLLPPGYEETLATGADHMREPGVAELYRRLALVTRGPIFDRRRLAEVWRLNTLGWRRLLGRQQELARHLSEGSRLLGEGRWGEAAAELEAAAAVDPDRPQPWCLLAAAREGAGELEAARQEAEECIRRDPWRYESRVALLELARHAGERGDRQRALAIVDEALGIRPRLLEPATVAAEILDDMGDVERAVVVNRRTLADHLEPAMFRYLAGGQFFAGYRAQLEATVHLNLARQLAGLGLRPEAVEHLRDALRLNPGFDAAARMLAALDRPGARPPGSSG